METFHVEMVTPSGNYVVIPFMTWPADLDESSARQIGDEIATALGFDVVRTVKGD